MFTKLGNFNPEIGSWKNYPQKVFQFGREFVGSVKVFKYIVLNTSYLSTTDSVSHVLKEECDKTP